MFSIAVNARKAELSNHAITIAALLACGTAPAQAIRYDVLPAKLGWRAVSPPLRRTATTLAVRWCHISLHSVHWC